MGNDLRKSLRILVVDDDSMSREALSAVIRENEYQVVTAENAKSALSIISKGKTFIHIIVVDTELPDMDIFEFIQIVNEQRKLPIVVVCQMYEKDFMTKAIQKGAMYCLVKPVMHEHVSDLWAYVYIKRQAENTLSTLWNNPSVMNLEDEAESNHNKNEESRLEMMNKDHLTPQDQQELQDIDKLTTIYSSISEILKIMNALGTNKGFISSDLQRRLSKDMDEESLMSTGIHILVVDCHINSLIATSRVLRESKYKVVAATNAKSALDILQEGKDNVQLVLMDTKLPDMDELEFISIIGRQYKLPLIAICHSYKDPILVDALANGAMFSMRKPVTHCQARYLWQFISIHARRVIRESQTQNNPDEKTLLVEGENSQHRHKESKIQVMDEDQTERLLHQQIFLITKQLTCIHSSMSEVLNIMKALEKNKGHVSSKSQIHPMNSNQGQPSDAGATITSGSYLVLGSQLTQQEGTFQYQQKYFMQNNNINLKAAACHLMQIKAPQKAVLQAKVPVSKLNSMDPHSSHLSSQQPASASCLSKRTSQSRRPPSTKKNTRHNSQKTHAPNDRSQGSGSVVLRSPQNYSSSITAQTSKFAHLNSAATPSDQQHLAHYGSSNFTTTSRFESTVISFSPNTQGVNHSTSGFLGSNRVNNSSLVGLELIQGKTREFFDFNKGLKGLCAKKYAFPSMRAGKKFYSGSSYEERPRQLPLGGISSQNQQQQLHWSQLPDSLFQSASTIGISMADRQDLSQGTLILSPEMQQRSQLETESTRPSNVWSNDPYPPQALTTKEVDLLCPPSALPPYSPTLACPSQQIPPALMQGLQTAEQLHRTSSKYAGLVLSDLENLMFKPSPVATQPSQPGDSQDLFFSLDEDQIDELLAALQSPP